MPKATLYYATNRRHVGDDRWNPSGYGTEPSQDGTENLRFGRVTLTYDKSEALSYLQKDCGFGEGDGMGLANYLQKQSNSAVINAFEEKLDKRKADIDQAKSKFGSTKTFRELRRQMDNGTDILIFIHGFNVSWWESVARAFVEFRKMMNCAPGNRCGMAGQTCGEFQSQRKLSKSRTLTAHNAAASPRSLDELSPLEFKARWAERRSEIR